MCEQHRSGALRAESVQIMLQLYNCSITYDSALARNCRPVYQLTVLCIKICINIRPQSTFTQLGTKMAMCTVLLLQACIYVYI